MFLSLPCCQNFVVHRVLHGIEPSFDSKKIWGLFETVKAPTQGSCFCRYARTEQKHNLPVSLNSGLSKSLYNKVLRDPRMLLAIAIYLAGKKKDHLSPPMLHMVILPGSTSVELPTGIVNLPSGPDSMHDLGRIPVESNGCLLSNVIGSFTGWVDLTLCLLIRLSLMWRVNSTLFTSPFLSDPVTIMRCIRPGLQHRSQTDLSPR